MTRRARTAALTMTKLQPIPVRSDSRIFRGLTVFCLLTMCAGVGYAQTTKAEAHSAGKHATTPDDSNGLINVQQSDLLKQRVTDNWVSYNGDYTGARHSDLTQITPGNVSRLQAQWVFHLRTVSPLEVTPVVVAGIMFVTSANDAYALDAKTGKVLWHHVRAISRVWLTIPASITIAASPSSAPAFTWKRTTHICCVSMRAGAPDLGCALRDRKQELRCNQRTLDRERQSHRRGFRWR